MKFAGAVPLLFVALGTFASCAASTPPPASPPASDGDATGAAPSPADGSDGAAAETAEPTQVGRASSEGRATGKRAEGERQAPGAGALGRGPEADADHCPAGMVYVEGEYCTADSNHQAPDAYGNTPGGGASDIEAVERQCLREWYAPQNKKRVCELFDDEVTCRGKKVKKRFCIDRYAWPNARGQEPEVMNRFHQAQVKCAAVGKRLCTESEWTMSCEGPELLPFPYGLERDATKCHGDEEWDSPNMSKVAARDPSELRRLYKGKPSGQSECVGEYGVYDLPGNTDEVVASETFEAGWRGKYDSVHTGGPWYKGVRNQCRPKIYTHDEGFYYYFLSFRCCADADAESVDPRTPKQKRDGWDMRRVERIAGLTVEEMRALLEKKKTDPTCGCTTTKCRTFCGTLLGDASSPGAKGPGRAPGSEPGSTKQADP